MDWKGELFITWWGHESSAATDRGAHHLGVDLTMEAIAQIIHEWAACAAINQANEVNFPRKRGQRLGFRYGETWQTAPLPWTHQGKHYILAMVEATIGWLATYPVNHCHSSRHHLRSWETHFVATRYPRDNGIHFQHNLINPWAKKHGMEWMSHPLSPSE